MLVLAYIHTIIIFLNNKRIIIVFVLLKTASRKYELLLTHSCILVLELPPITI